MVMVAVAIDIKGTVKDIFGGSLDDIDERW